LKNSCSRLSILLPLYCFKDCPIILIWLFLANTTGKTYFLRSAVSKSYAIYNAILQDMCISLTITSPTVHLRISVVPFEMVYVISNGFDCLLSVCTVVAV